MYRLIDRIWFRFGLYVATSVFVTLSAVTSFAMWSDAKDKTEFLTHASATLPVEIREEMAVLIQSGRIHSKRADTIYHQYSGEDDPGIFVMVVFGLFLSVFLGLLTAFFAARIFARPLTSVMDAALRIANGDLAARSTSYKRRGELTLLSENFNAMANALETLESERKETLASLSHELRTPLTILQSRLHAICDGVMPHDQKESLLLLDQTEHLVRLVDDIHTYSLINANRFLMHRTYLNLGSFIEDLIPSFAPRAKNYGVKFEVKTDTVFVNADKDRLRQVVANLIENSLHYAATGGLIAIEVSQSGGQALLVLSDRGPGVAQDEIGLLLTPFFRGKSSTVNQKSGSGLGLSIVQSIVHQHGGSIAVMNHPQGGAHFTIQLPLVSSD